MIVSYINCPKYFEGTYHQWVLYWQRIEWKNKNGFLKWHYWFTFESCLSTKPTFDKRIIDSKTILKCTYDYFKKDKKKKKCNLFNVF